MRYAVIYEKTSTGYSAYVPDLPGYAAAGETQQETNELMRGAVKMHLVAMREDGTPFPNPRPWPITSPFLLAAGNGPRHKERTRLWRTWRSGATFSRWQPESLSSAVVGVRRGVAMATYTIGVITKSLLLFLATFAVAGLFFLCWVGYELVAPGLPGGSTPRMGYTEFVSIALTAVTVILAALGIAIGLAAIWGYSGIRDASISAAETAAGETIHSYLSSDAGVKLIEGIVHQRYESTIQASQMVSAFATDSSGTAQLGGTESIGMPYPENRRSDSEPDKPSGTD